MKTSKPRLEIKQIVKYFAVALLATTILVTLTYGHGGKHEESFSNFLALQQAMELYDKLVSNGKLEKSWETELVNVNISKRKGNGGEEIIVAFNRHSGHPSSVYIYFNPDGRYSGSNFNGK